MAAPVVEKGELQLDVGPAIREVGKLGAAIARVMRQATADTAAWEKSLQTAAQRNPDVRRQLYTTGYSASRRYVDDTTGLASTQRLRVRAGADLQAEGIGQGNLVFKAARQAQVMNDLFARSGASPASAALQARLGPAQTLLADALRDFQAAPDASSRRAAAKPLAKALQGANLAASEVGGTLKGERQARIQADRLVRNTAKQRATGIAAATFLDDLQSLRASAAAGAAPIDLAGLDQAISELSANPQELANVRKAYGQNIAGVRRANRAATKGSGKEQQIADLEASAYRYRGARVDPLRQYLSEGFDLTASLSNLDTARTNLGNAMKGGADASTVAQLREVYKEHKQTVDKELGAARTRLEASRKEDNIAQRLTRVFTMTGAIHAIGGFAKDLAMTPPNLQGGLAYSGGSALAQAGSQLAMQRYLATGKGLGVAGALLGLGEVLDIAGEKYKKGAGLQEQANERAAASDLVLGRLTQRAGPSRSELNRVGAVRDGIGAGINFDYLSGLAPETTGPWWNRTKTDRAWLSSARLARAATDRQYRSDREYLDGQLSPFYATAAARDQAINAFSGVSGGGVAAIGGEVYAGSERDRAVAVTARALYDANRTNTSAENAAKLFSGQIRGQFRGVTTESVRNMAGLAHSLGQYAGDADALTSGIMAASSSVPGVVRSPDEDARFMAGFKGAVPANLLPGLSQAGAQAAGGARNSLLAGYGDLIEQATMLRALRKAGGDQKKAFDIAGTMSLEEQRDATKEYFGQELTERAFMSKTGMNSEAARAVANARSQDVPAPSEIDMGSTARTDAAAQVEILNSINAQSAEMVRLMKLQEARENQRSVNLKTNTDSIFGRGTGR